MDTSAIRSYIDNLGLLVLLQKTNAVISGSTVLYFILKEMKIEPNFEPGDLDIFHRRSRFFDEWILNRERLEIISNKSTYSEEISNLSDGMLLPIAELISRVIRGKMNETKVDFVELYIEPTEYIKNYFDLDFCRVAFDGYGFIIFNEEAVRKKAAVLREITVCFNNRLGVLGFPDYEEAIKKMDLNHNDPISFIRRIEKYKSRGFKIDISPDFKLNINQEMGSEEELKTRYEDENYDYSEKLFLVRNISFDSMFLREKDKYMATVKNYPMTVFFRKSTRFILPLTLDVFTNSAHHDKTYDMIVTILENKCVMAEEILCHQNRTEKTGWRKELSFSWKMPQALYLIENNKNKVVSGFIGISYPKELIGIVETYLS